MPIPVEPDHCGCPTYAAISKPLLVHFEELAEEPVGQRLKFFTLGGFSAHCPIKRRLSAHWPTGGCSPDPSTGPSKTLLKNQGYQPSPR